jgi:hypothetical protein
METDVGIAECLMAWTLVVDGPPGEELVSHVEKCYALSHVSKETVSQLT